MTDLTMPSLAESMTEGVISRWLKRPGERVEEDEEVVEIETEKVTMAYPAPESGYLEIVAAEGSVVEVGAVIARLVAEPASAAAPPEPEPEPEPAPAVIEPAATAPAPAPAPANGQVRATPLARQLAEQHGADLAVVGGSGPRGRITRSDVARSLGLELPVVQSPPPRPAPKGGPSNLSRAQQTIARRMSESHAAIPDFQVETEVAMNRAVALREELRELGNAPSLNDLVVRACALALREHPRVNGSFRDEGFVLYDHVNIGFAVAAEDTLIVPVVANADRRSLGELAAETRRLAEAVRGGRLEPADLAGATFTISNLGMFGMTAITPVIDAPQAAILGVGSIRDTLALENGTVIERRLMTLRLSCDHRILYGADAARFLSTVRELLEQPLRLLL